MVTPQSGPSNYSYYKDPSYNYGIPTLESTRPSSSTAPTTNVNVESVPQDTTPSPVYGMSKTQADEYAKKYNDLYAEKQEADKALKNTLEAKKRNYAWTQGEQTQILAGMVAPAVNTIRASASATRVNPALNKYRYRAYDQMSKNRANPNNNELRSAYTSMDRQLRNSAGNNSVNRANRLAAFNTYSKQIGAQERQAQVANQQMATTAAQNLVNIGDQETRAREMARTETNRNIVNKFNKEGVAMEQMGQLAGKTGEMMVDKEEQMFTWNAIAANLADNFTLADYNLIVSGKVTAQDLIRWKKNEAAKKQAEETAAEKEKIAADEKTEYEEWKREREERKRKQKEKEEEVVTEDLDDVAGASGKATTTTTTTTE